MLRKHTFYIFCVLLANNRLHIAFENKCHCALALGANAVVARLAADRGILYESVEHTFFDRGTCGCFKTKNCDN